MRLGKGILAHAYGRTESKNQADRSGYPGRSRPLPGQLPCQPLRRDRHAPGAAQGSQNNDRAVMQAYGFDVKTTTETNCVAESMRIYQKLTGKEGRQWTMKRWKTYNAQGSNKPSVLAGIIGRK